MIANVFKYIVIGIVAIIALRIALGLAFGLIGLLIACIPLLLVGFVVYKVIGPKKPKTPEISEADRRWLES